MSRERDLFLTSLPGFQGASGRYQSRQTHPTLHASSSTIETWGGVARLAQTGLPARDRNRDRRRSLGVPGMRKPETQGEVGRNRRFSKMGKFDGK